ncbi:MAG: TonB-dependent receptor, partial [Gammaproteobacteria bacterium]
MKTKKQRAAAAFATILAGTLGATSASAESAIEEVVVQAKSIKASQMAAIEAKRMADNVADVISADAIGRFPDQNLADALGRVPGMAIERDQG